MKSLQQIGITITFVVQLLITDGKLMLAIEHFGNCESKFDNAVVHVENTTYGMTTKSHSEYNTTLVFSRDIVGQLWMKVESWTCSDNYYSGCEYQFKAPMDNACHRLAERNQFWSTFTDHMVPKWTCPAKKAIYKTTHVSIHSDIVTSLMRSDLYYRTVFIVMEDKKIIGCILAHSRLITINPRSSAKKKPQNG